MIEIPDNASYAVDFEGDFSSNAVNPSTVKIWGTDYRVGDVLVLKRISYDALEVGLLKGIVVDDKVFFVCAVFRAIASKGGIYTTEHLLRDETVMYKLLADYHPLKRIGSLDNFSIVLHNFVSES